MRPRVPAMPSDQPIILSVEEGNPNGAKVRFLIDNAALPADADSYERVVLVFNGEDDERSCGRAAGMEGLQVARLRGDLLADRRARPLATAGIGFCGD